MFSSPNPPPQPAGAVTGDVAKAGLVSKLKKYISNPASLTLPLPPVSILSQGNHHSAFIPPTAADESKAAGKENKQAHSATGPSSSPLPTSSSSPSLPAPARSLSLSGPLSLSSFDIGKKLGSGKYGHVYLAREKQSGFIVALKQISLKQLDSDTMHHQLLREIEIQTQIRHVNVLRMYQYFIQQRHIYLVLEFAPRGQLYDHLLSERHFTEKKTAHYIGDLASAFHFCHCKHVMHRDIKPENLLLGFNNIVKIADFGWSVHAPRDRRQTMCGTLDYLSPEMVLNATGHRLHYDHTVDIWCLGVLMFEFLYGQPPFFTAPKPDSTEDDPTPTYERIKNVDLRFPADIAVSDEAKDLIRRMIVREPRDRIALIDVVQHRWILRWNGGEEAARKRVERMRRWERNSRREGSLFNGNIVPIMGGGQTSHPVFTVPASSVSSVSSSSSLTTSQVFVAGMGLNKALKL